MCETSSVRLCIKAEENWSARPQETELKKIENVTELTVHIVGSNVIEMLGIIKWEYIVHRLPKLKTLHLVFIGEQTLLKV